MGCATSRAANVETGRRTRSRNRNSSNNNSISSSDREIYDTLLHLAHGERNSLDTSNRVPSFLISGGTHHHRLRHGLENRFGFDRTDWSTTINGNSVAADQSLDQLRSDLVTLEQLFHSLLGQQIGGSVSTAVNTPSACPPASQHTIDNIPTITVSEHDFQDNNKECCICFLEHKVNDTVSRLPCGHFFHGECINEWLLKRCTCPICRWELETEDRLFEIERVERMKSRRVRIKDHELGRLCIEGLQEMAGMKDVKDRTILIQTIRSLDNVDIITQGKQHNVPKIDCDHEKEDKAEISNVAEI
jgi:hypothetical protein